MIVNKLSFCREAAFVQMVPQITLKERLFCCILTVEKVLLGLLFGR